MTRFDRILVRCAFLTGASVLVVALFLLAPLFGKDLGWLGVPDPVWHTIGHVTVYGALAVALVLGFGGRWAPAWLAAMALAGAEEAHQAYVPGRCVDPRDYLLNAAAITLAMAACAMAAHVRRRSRMVVAPAPIRAVSTPAADRTAGR